MKSIQYPIIIFFILVSGCKTDLSRPGVPVYWGMHLEKDFHLQELADNLVELNAIGADGILIEMELYSDSSDHYFPKITTLNEAIFDSIISLISSSKIPYGLVIHSANNRKLNAHIHDPKIWLDSLGKLCEKLITKTLNYPPKRIILGKDLQIIENNVTYWESSMRRLHKSTIPFAYNFTVTSNPNLDLLKVFDEIAISYTPPPRKDHKAACRDWNKSVAQIAKEMGMPVFISHANLIGDQQRPQFEYRLSFWGDDTQLTGICINTLYSRVAFRDTSSYFQLGGDEEFWEYYKAYRSK